MNNPTDIIERMKELQRKHDELQNEILSNPDLPQDLKNQVLESKEKLIQDEMEYQNHLDENKGRKITGYDPETFYPIYE